MTMLKVPSRLDDETEELIHRVIGCCIRVRRELGPGLLEGIYRRAVGVELRLADLPFQLEKRLPVIYRGVAIHTQRLDVVVGDRLLLELKSVERVTPLHQAQVISYLRVSGLPVALLVNFNVRILPHGLQRIVL